MATVKGQETLDAANARRKATPKERATGPKQDPNLALTETHTPESGYEKPKTLRQLEHIVESNALRGAGFWRKAADALLTIKTEKLWKKARDENDEPYPSFVVYAEERFGFKKTYAYDLVKAAQRKPEAITERTARQEMAEERKPRGIDRSKALDLFQTAWAKWEDRAGDIRDRVEGDDELVAAWDDVMRRMGDAFRDFVSDHAVIAGTAEDVSPLREDMTDAELDHAENGEEDGDDDDVPTE